MSMSVEKEKRRFVLRSLEQLGSTAPSKYAEMLDATPPNRVIEKLDPWVFDHDPESAASFCSKALGRRVLPFAQAVDEDLLACFEVDPSLNPAVVVINPWAQDEKEWVKTEVEVQRLPNYEAWLVYAKSISDYVRERDREEADDTEL